MPSASLPTVVFEIPPRNPRRVNYGPNHCSGNCITAPSAEGLHLHRSILEAAWSGAGSETISGPDPPAVGFAHEIAKGPPQRSPAAPSSKRTTEGSTRGAGWRHPTPRAGRCARESTNRPPVRRGQPLPSRDEPCPAPQGPFRNHRDSNRFPVAAALPQWLAEPRLTRGRTAEGSSHFDDVSPLFGRSIRVVRLAGRGANRDRVRFVSRHLG